MINFFKCEMKYYKILISSIVGVILLLNIINLIKPIEEYLSGVVFLSIVIIIINIFIFIMKTLILLFKNKKDINCDDWNLYKKAQSWSSNLA